LDRHELGLALLDCGKPVSSIHPGVYDR